MLWGFFKRCSKCSQKIPPSDGHKLSLFCLGEMHNIEACGICAQFSHQAKRNRAARLSVFLLEKSLRPQLLPMEPKALDISAPLETLKVLVPIVSVPTMSQPAEPSTSTDQSVELPHVKVKLPLPTGSEALTPAIQSEKQSKVKKHKRPCPAAQESKQEQEPAKKKKPKQVSTSGPDSSQVAAVIESSTTSIPSPGSLPPDELFQTPDRLSTTDKTDLVAQKSPPPRKRLDLPVRQSKTCSDTSLQHPESDAMVSLSSESEEERLGARSHTPPSRPH